MKKLLPGLLLATMFIANGVSAQTAPPLIQFSQLYGGSLDDHPGHLIQTPDKGFLIGGWTTSADGQVSGYHGGTSDGWAVKTDSAGNFLWGKTIGGANADDITAVAATATSYIVAGYSYSTDGDFDTSAEPSSSIKGYVAWLNPANGTIRRVKAYSGTISGQIFSMKVLDNGNLVVLGILESTTLTKKMWIAELDSTGNIIWDKYYGTGDNATGENPICIIQKKGGGFMAVAQTNSNSGDVHGLIGLSDVWMLNVDDTGKILWAKCYGSSSGVGPLSVCETSDSGFICSGETNSGGGDVIGYHGGEDYWIFKTNDTGKVVWSNAVGGSGNDFIYDAHGTCDNGVVVSGYTTSTDGDITNSKGSFDIFVVRIDSSGHKVWAHNYGGSGVETEGYITTTTDDGYAMLGFTGVADSDITGTLHGQGDIWLAKLAPDGLQNYCPPAITLETQTITKEGLSIYPNPVTDELTITSAGNINTVVISNLLGQQVIAQSYAANQVQVNVAGLSPGIYLIKINGSEVRKFVKE